MKFIFLFLYIDIGLSLTGWQTGFENAKKIAQETWDGYPQVTAPCLLNR